MIRTIAQALIDEGEETGIQRGAVEAKRDALIRILYRRFEVSQTEIAETVRSLNRIEELDELIDRAITAKTFDEVGLQKK